MKRVQYEKSATRIKSNTKLVQHKKEATWRDCNMKQHEKCKSEKCKKGTQGWCTRVHKWITGSPLTDRYTLVDIVSPATVIRIIIYPDISHSKISWDKTLPYWIVRKWENWEEKLPTKVMIPRKCSHTAASWNWTRINCKQTKMVIETINNIKTRISRNTYGSKFSRQHSKLVVKSKHWRCLWMVR